jgi:hypothetical protein
VTLTDRSTDAPIFTDRDVVAWYFAHGMQPVFWPQIGDAKGPTREGWTQERPTVADYRDGYRVGLFTGIETAPGKYLHDVDIDWSPGIQIAYALLRPTGGVYGRASKRISHCLFTLPEALPSRKFEDPTDKTCLIELRGTKQDGSIGMQSMAPPSIWSKGTHKEQLTFVNRDDPQHFESAALLTARVTLAAIGMLLAKHLGVNGFGHNTRLACFGFLLRAGVAADDLIAMGEAMSSVCHNLEVHDVRKVVESTAKSLTSGAKKVKGGPALAKLVGKDGKSVIARINEWLGRDQDFVRDHNGKIIADNQSEYPPCTRHPGIRVGARPLRRQADGQRRAARRS